MDTSASTRSTVRKNTRLRTMTKKGRFILAVSSAPNMPVSAVASRHSSTTIHSSHRLLSLALPGERGTKPSTKPRVYTPTSSTFTAAREPRAAGSASLTVMGSRLPLLAEKRAKNKISSSAASTRGLTNWAQRMRLRGLPSAATRHTSPVAMIKGPGALLG